MKKILTFIAAAAMLACISCDDSMLDITNPNTFTTGDFWKTEADVNAGLTSVYNMFYKQGTWTRNMFTQMDGMADDGVSYAGWTELNEWTKFKFTDYNFSEVGLKIWQEHYKGIFRANQVLDNVDNVSFSSEEAKNRVIGQARFMRGFFYYYLEILWENVPIVMHTSQPSDKPMQGTSDQIWAIIEDDMKAAAEYLPAKWESKSDLGRVTKGAALAYLGKAYMQQHKWQEAKDALSWLVEGDGKQYYDLMGSYGDNFLSTTENNAESVFEIQFSEVFHTGYDVDFSTTSNLGTQFAINASPKGLGWNNIQANRWLVDYYKREKTVDGKNDMRLFYNLWYNNRGKDFPDQSDTLIYGRTWASNNTSWGNQVFIHKYMSKLNGTETEFYWTDDNYRLIRYSDVLLCYAEILTQLNTSPTPLALDCLNRVRQRVNLPRIQDSQYYNGTLISTDKNAFLEHLKTERALELPLECVRWMDLKRWGLDDQSTIDELKSRDADFQYFVIGKSDRMPIPQTDVDNNPNLEQNPGY